MSDLANSCEYLTVEKLCSAVSESEKAKTNRTLRCQNDEKLSCCYLCSYRSDCAVSCKYLGQISGQSASVEAPEPETESAPTESKEVEVNATQIALAAWCSVCNVEMSQTKTTFRVDGWSGPHPNLGEGELPASVCLCPRCGRIEFRADIKK